MTTPATGAGATGAAPVETMCTGTPARVHLRCRATLPTWRPQYRSSVDSQACIHLLVLALCTLFGFTSVWFKWRLRIQFLCVATAWMTSIGFGIVHLLYTRKLIDNASCIDLRQADNLFEPCDGSLIQNRWSHIYGKLLYFCVHPCLFSCARACSCARVCVHCSRLVPLRSDTHKSEHVHAQK
jgi:hypothetical protein